MSRYAEALAAGPVKPALRGWLHAAMFPIVLVAGAVLVALAHPGVPRAAAVVFVVSSAILFGTSAMFHRGHWGPRAYTFLRRLDHSNIFVIIAGSYTPFALCLLPSSQSKVLLTIVWCGAAAGVIFKLAWLHAPRWVSTPLYVVLGWVSVFYIRPMIDIGGPVVVSLIAAGGLLYTAGAVVYGIKRPDPSPRWFGFHEVFHALTVLAFTAHFTAAILVIGAPAPA